METRFLDNIDGGYHCLDEALSETPDTETVAKFVPGPGIRRLDIQFDVEALRNALDEILRIEQYSGDAVFAIPLTQIPFDESSTTGNALRGRYWTRADARYIEEEREGNIDEFQFTAFRQKYEHTYFKTIYDRLSSRFRLGRVRLLKKEPRSALSWHRDPEPRIHIPIITNPGAIMMVGNHCTHLPADGSVYFTDTRAYHNAVNGGETTRVHLVAALPL